MTIASTVWHADPGAVSAYKSSSRSWFRRGCGVNWIGYSPVQHAVQNDLLSGDWSCASPATGKERLVLRPVASVRAATTERTIESSERYASASLVMYWLISSTE